MKAIQIDRPKHLQVVEAPTPSPEEGQVLVRNHLLSICGSDMRSFRRVAPEEDYPFAAATPCHECVGVVVESRAPGVEPGQWVIALPAPAGEGRVYGGGAEYMVTSASRTIPLPPDADPATYLMCQPVGTVIFSCQRMGSVLGKRVVVLGQGAIGLTFTTLLTRQGAREVVAVDPLDYRLEQARLQGATITLNPMRDDVAAIVAELTSGQGADVVVEAAGRGETVNQAPGLVRRYGTLVLFGLPEENVIPFDYMKLMRQQPTVIPTLSAASEDPAGGIREAVSLVSQGRLDVGWLTTHRLPFEEASWAYEMYEGYLDNIIKVVMEL